MRVLVVAVALVLSLPALPVKAQGPYKDPWDPAVEKAAEAAVARLGAKRALDVRATVLAIPSLAAQHVS
jgi:hypothetical protein